MTGDEILAMAPGRPLDELVAKHAMYSIDPRPYPAYSTDYTAMRRLLSRVRNWTPTRHAAWSNAMKSLVVAKTTGRDVVIRWPDAMWFFAPRMPEFVAKAALLAVIVE